MKTRLNLTIDEEIVARCKKYAKRHKVSVSSLVEQSLCEVAAGEAPSFAARWRGRFQVAERSGPRYRKLKGRFLK